MSSFLKLGASIAFLLVPCGLVGCMSLPEASSGAVGCPPDEIEISNESEAYTSHTWTATCRGERFYCTDQTSYIGGQDTGGIIHNVSCTPELEPAPPLLPQRPVAPPPPQWVEAPVPQKVVGFRFWSTVEESQTACEVSGHSWTTDSDLYRCDGIPADVGLPTTARLGFCDGKLCDLTAIAALGPGSAGEEDFKTLWSSLRKQYGAPGVERKSVPAGCAGTFIGCVAAGEASWQAQWKWQGGERIVAKTFSESGGARLGIRYVFGEADRADPNAPVKGVDGTAF